MQHHQQDNDEFLQEQEILLGYQKLREIALKYCNEVIQYRGSEISPNIKREISETYGIKDPTTLDFIIRQLVLTPTIDKEEVENLGTYKFTYKHNK